jgi:hypothetical protein
MLANSGEGPSALDLAPPADFRACAAGLRKASHTLIFDVGASLQKTPKRGSFASGERIIQGLPENIFCYNMATANSAKSIQYFHFIGILLERRMKLDRNDRIGSTPPSENRFFITALLIGLVVAGLAFLASPELGDEAWRAVSSAASLLGVKTPNDQFADLYKRLGMAPLPPGLASSSKISASLAKLAREPCDKHAIFALGEAVAANGEGRMAANAYLGFAAACPNGEGEKNRAAQLLLQLGDSESVIVIMNALILKNPGVANYRYLRGKALAAGKRYQEAIADYASAIELQHNPRAVNEKVFMELANIYAATGKPCDAATIILGWVALAPTARNTSKARKMIEEYAAQGCGRGATGELSQL